MNRDGRTTRLLRAAVTIGIAILVSVGCDRGETSGREGSASNDGSAETSAETRPDARPTTEAPSTGSPEDANDIVLDAAIVDGLRFEGLKGTEDDPIVIRPRDPNRPTIVTNATGDWSIELSDCRHVRIENLQIFNSRIGGLLVRGRSDSPCRSIEVASSDVLPRTSTIAYETGIRIEHTEDVSIRDVRVLQAATSSIDVHRARSVRIENVVIRGIETGRFGVRLGAGVRRATLASIACLTLSGNAFALGVVDPSDQQAGNGVDPACADVVLTRCSTDLGLAPVLLGSVANASIEYCSFMFPRESVVGSEPLQPGWPAASNIDLRGNLVEWQPGMIRTIFDPGAHDAIATLGENLWWSKELPETLDAQGGFPAAADTQHIDIDPQIVRVRLQPLNALAIPFGHLARGAGTTPPAE